ncbi:MAG: hypothetical protein IJP95_03150 [Bacteroidales bacterium]|nr:hypothetical protein [Bacteroidales bacterium]
MPNSEKYQQLRKEYPVFCYESISYSTTADGLLISFRFTAGTDIVFEPKTLIPHRSFADFDRLSQRQYNTLVFQMGMIEMVSYWKCVCSPKVVIKPFTMGQQQLEFWKKLYFNGLGEFFYINGISATQDDFMDIVCESGETMQPIDFETDTGKHLVPIGGGKDSVVTLEVLRKAGTAFRPLIINPRGATTECARIAGFAPDEVFEIHRTIDKRLLELNGQGYLNGHTPFSAMLAFYTLLASALTGYGSIALSNENSANEATVIGTSVNHQYSKSIEFENDFRQYVKQYVSPNFNYFSFLRPLAELQIAMLFAQNPQYFSVFRSCNVGSKQNIWCGNCPKCLFAYIILSPFIEPATMKRIFDKNLLDDSTLQNHFDELTGLAPTKPFECVGTISEVNAALAMTKRRFYATGGAPLLLQDFHGGFDMAALSDFCTENNLSEPLQTLLRSEVEKAQVYFQKAVAGNV